MKRLFTISLIVLLFLSVPLSATAHSGGTDGAGGHHSDHGYHYHHGYPAHQHPGGVCPYDFKDNTDQSPDTGKDNGDSKKNPTAHSYESGVNEEEWEWEIPDWKKAILAVFVSFFLYLPSAFAVVMLGSIVQTIFRLESPREKVDTIFLNTSTVAISLALSFSLYFGAAFWYILIAVVFLHCACTVVLSKKYPHKKGELANKNEK